MVGIGERLVLSLCVYIERDKVCVCDYRERDIGSHSHGGDRRRLVLEKTRVAFVGLKVHLEVIKRFALRQVRVRLRTQDA
jgi:hypothetical protein